MGQQKLAKCFKCNHKCVSRCYLCDDAVCYFHSQLVDSNKRQCFRCEAKYYIIAQQSALEKAELDAEFEASTRAACEQCGEYAIILCKYCDKTVCKDHRTQLDESDFACLDCYYMLQEISPAELRAMLDSAIETGNQLSSNEQNL